MPDTPAPWHHWPVAILALLFYGLGALDYSFIQLRLGFYMARFTPEQVTLVAGFGSLIQGLWALAVWGGLLGAWLLLIRNRFSVLLLCTSFGLITFLGVWISLFTTPTLPGVAGFMGLYAMTGTAAIAFLFYLYARWERASKKI